MIYDEEDKKLRIRVNLNLTQKNWCSYKGECLQHLSISNGLCYHCCHKIQIDIPTMIEEYIKNVSR